jgi:hypothetical protein
VSTGSQILGEFVRQLTGTDPGHRPVEIVLDSTNIDLDVAASVESST